MLPTLAKGHPGAQVRDNALEQSPLRIPLERSVRLVSRSGTGTRHISARDITLTENTVRCADLNFCAMRLSRDLKKNAKSDK